MLHITPNNEETIINYIQATTCSAPKGWPGFYKNPPKLFKWPILNKIKNYESADIAYGTHNEIFKRDNSQQEAAKKYRLNLYGFDTATHLANIWSKDLDQNKMLDYGCVINGIGGLFENDRIREAYREEILSAENDKQEARKTAEMKAFLKKKKHHVKWLENLVGEDNLQVLGDGSRNFPSRSKATKKTNQKVDDEDDDQEIPEQCLLTLQKRDELLETMKKALSERNSTTSILKNSIILLHPAKFSMSLFVTKNILPEIHTTKQWKEIIISSFQDFDVQVDALSICLGITRQLDLTRVLVLPTTSFSEPNFASAIKAIKLEKDDLKRPIINMIKEHPTHKGVWSIKLNKYNNSKKFNLKPSKLTCEIHLLILTKEAIKRIRTPSILQDYARPVRPSSTYKLQLITSDIYKSLVATFVSLGQIDALFCFSDYIKSWGKFRDEGVKNLKIYNFPDADSDKAANSSEYSKTHLTIDSLRFPPKTSKIALTESQKKIVLSAALPNISHTKDIGKAQIDYFQDKHYCYVYGQSGSGKSKCLQVRILELLRLRENAKCVYINLKRNESFNDNISKNVFNYHSDFFEVDVDLEDLGGSEQEEFQFNDISELLIGLSFFWVIFHLFTKTPSPKTQPTISKTS